MFSINALRPAQPAAVSPVTADHSYDDIEHIRSARGALVSINATADHSYDNIERIRSARALGVRQVTPAQNQKGGSIPLPPFHLCCICRPFNPLIRRNVLCRSVPVPRYPLSAFSPILL
ncbi:MAG TPA: hypothetical protein VFD70_21310 [Anaerolineae bacterium]|nr:hypothetical protein [Anaerolineae bacterium]